MATCDDFVAHEAREGVPGGAPKLTEDQCSVWVTSIGSRPQGAGAGRVDRPAKEGYLLPEEVRWLVATSTFLGAESDSSMGSRSQRPAGCEIAPSSDGDRSHLAQDGACPNRLPPCRVGILSVRSSVILLDDEPFSGWTPASAACEREWGIQPRVDTYGSSQDEPGLRCEFARMRNSRSESGRHQQQDVSTPQGVGRLSVATMAARTHDHRQRALGHQTRTMEMIRDSRHLIESGPASVVLARSNGDGGRPEVLYCC